MLELLLESFRSHFWYIATILSESTAPIRRAKGSIIFVYPGAIVSGRRRQIREGISMRETTAFKNNLGFMFLSIKEILYKRNSSTEISKGILIELSAGEV